LADPQQVPQDNRHIKVAEGMGLTVALAPTLITLHWLTDDQLENLAAMNGITAVSLAFLGISIGAAISYHVALITSNFKDAQGKTNFETYKWAAIILSVFFGLIFIVALGFSLVKLARIKKRAIVPQASL
jgi:hypothetical protein